MSSFCSVLFCMPQNLIFQSVHRMVFACSWIQKKRLPKILECVAWLHFSLTFLHLKLFSIKCVCCCSFQRWIKNRRRKGIKSQFKHKCHSSTVITMQHRHTALNGVLTLTLLKIEIVSTSYSSYDYVIAMWCLPASSAVAAAVAKLPNYLHEFVCAFCRYTGIIFAIFKWRKIAFTSEICSSSNNENNDNA